MKVEISVVIPTLNRGRAIEQTLVSVLDQDFGAGRHEVLLVDSSTDATMDFVRQRFAKEIAAQQLKIIDERRVGSHYAKNKGLTLAEGSIVAYLEDDAEASHNWLSKIWAAMSDKNIACVGGPVDPIWEASPPEWLLRYKEMFTILDLGDQKFQVTEPKLVGCNMALRRDVAIEVGGYNPDIMGPLLLGDGETGLQRKLLDDGRFQVIYDPEIRVRHHVPKKRMNFEYLERRYWNEGACHAYRFFQTRKPSQPLLLALSAYWALRSVLKFLQSKFPKLIGATRAEMSRFIGAFFRRQSSFYLKLATSKEFRQFVSREQWI